MRRVLPLLLLLACFAFAAGDVTGKWTGSMDIKMPDGSVAPTPVTAELKQTGATVTGTAGVAGADQFTLEKGALAGNQLTFEVHAPDGVYTIKATVVSDTQIKGDISFINTSGIQGTASLTLTRN